LKEDANMFGEPVFDINTKYFEAHGGYEYAKRFYKDAFHYTEEKNRN
jgi:hypothetical protein